MNEDEKKILHMQWRRVTWAGGGGEEVCGWGGEVMIERVDGVFDRYLAGAVPERGFWFLVHSIHISPTGFLWLV